MPWVWDTKEQAAFESLKRELCKDSVWMHFDPGLQVGISCDASNVGIGVVYSIGIQMAVNARLPMFPRC